MVWMLLRLATRTTQWLAIATSQLAANALSSILPAGAAAGRDVAGADAQRSGHRHGDRGIGHDRVHVVAVRDCRGRSGAAAAGGACSASSISRPVSTTRCCSARSRSSSSSPSSRCSRCSTRRCDSSGRVVQSMRNRVRRNERAHGRSPGSSGRGAQHAGAHARSALAASGGAERVPRSLFDYLALLAAVAAVGAHPRPSLIVVAYVSAVVLALIPITPGGLGFVEAGPHRCADPRRHPRQ